MATPIEPNPPRWSPSTNPASIVVPGLDTTASIHDQVDQIEQLITIKLQNIDANFSRIQHLMATRLLPAVKRYALGTEPVREAAKFWTSFYEQAAQVHIPRLDEDDEDGAQTQPSEPSAAAPLEDTTRTDVTPPRTPSEIAPGPYDVTASESSFMPANAVSSTPARPGHPDRTADEQPSWSASLESPMVRLKTELQRFAEEEGSVGQDTSSSYVDSIMYEEEDTVQQHLPIGPDKIATEKSATKPDRDEPKIKVQSSHIPHSALPTPRANATYISPLKVKSKTPIAIPKHIQSFLPAKLDNEPVFPSPRRPRFERTPRKPADAPSFTSTSTSASSSVLDIPSLTQQPSDSNQAPKVPAFNDSFDDSIDLMQGMSPPRTLAFARAPRSSVGLGLLPPLGRTPGKDLLPTLGRTPGKQAASRIRQDLLGDVQSQLGSQYSAASTKMRTPAFGYGASAVKDDTMSTIPTPPSLSRYMRHAYPSWTESNDTDASLATMMRRVGLEMPESSYKAGAIGSTEQTPDHAVLDVIGSHPGDDDSAPPGSHPTHADSDSDSDSLNDERGDTNQPSTAFLMASSREVDPDDSFGSSNSNHSQDSLEDAGLEDGPDAAVHPFARALDAGDGFEDSFESEGGDEPREEDEEVSETVFGIRPSQPRAAGELRMLGEDLLQDTIGIGGQLARAGRIEESPTPYGRG